MSRDAGLYMGKQDRSGTRQSWQRRRRKDSKSSRTRELIKIAAVVPCKIVINLRNLQTPVNAR